MRFATVRPPTDPDWMEFGPTFHGTNPAKRSVTIDFSTPEGRELVLRLVEHADVVVENFTPRVLGNVGLEYHDLFARNPDVVLLRMPAFGLDGPWRDRPGFAQTTEQVSGIAWMTGEAGGRGAGAQHHRPDRGDPRRVRGARRARSTATARAKASWSRCRWPRWR